MPATLHRDNWDQYAAIMEAENKRLRSALFQIQCEQLDMATGDHSLQKRKRHAMATRDRITTILKE